MCLIKEKATGKIGPCLWHFLAWTLGLLLLIPLFTLLLYFLAKNSSKESSGATQIQSTDRFSVKISEDPKSFPSEKSLFLTSDLERNAEREGWR